MRLIEMDFGKPKVIHGLDLNRSFSFVTFVRGALLSKIALFCSKNLLSFIIIIVNYRIPVDRKIVQYKGFLDNIGPVSFTDTLFICMWIRENIWSNNKLW